MEVTINQILPAQKTSRSSYPIRGQNKIGKRAARGRAQHGLQVTVPGDGGDRDNDTAALWAPPMSPQMHRVWPIHKV